MPNAGRTRLRAGAIAAAGCPRRWQAQREARGARAGAADAVQRRHRAMSRAGRGSARRARSDAMRAQPQRRSAARHGSHAARSGAKGAAPRQRRGSKGGATVAGPTRHNAALMRPVRAAARVLLARSCPRPPPRRALPAQQPAPPRPAHLRSHCRAMAAAAGAAGGASGTEARAHAARRVAARMRADAPAAWCRNATPRRCRARPTGSRKRSRRTCCSTRTTPWTGTPGASPCRCAAHIYAPCSDYMPLCFSQ